VGDFIHVDARAILSSTRARTIARPLPSWVCAIPFSSRPTTQRCWRTEPGAEGQGTGQETGRVEEYRKFGLSLRESMNGVAPVEWTHFIRAPPVRLEYFKLPRDLAALASSFGIALPAQVHGTAAVLTFSIECADRLLDAIPQASRRARFSASVVSCLRGEGFFNDDLTPELAGWLAQLREAAERRRVHGAFCQIVRELLANSEVMRTTPRHGGFIECAVREGRLMVELLLLILADVSTPPVDCSCGGFPSQPTWATSSGTPAGIFAVAKWLSGRRWPSGATGLRNSPTDFFPGNFIRGPRAASRWGIQSLFTELIWFPIFQVALALKPRCCSSHAALPNRGLQLFLNCFHQLFPGRC